jgi:hypothetical protein
MIICHAILVDREEDAQSIYSAGFPVQDIQPVCAVLFLLKKQ